LFDLLAQRADGMVRIAAIESGSAAADAGLKIGDRIIAIDGRPIERVIHDLMPKCLIRPDPAADAYTINVAVAGYRGKARLLSVSSTTVESDRDHWRKIAQNLAETRSRKWWFW
ncbi:PDZ domain-containing protein, partial [Acetobacter sp. DmW_125135]